MLGHGCMRERQRHDGLVKNSLQQKVIKWYNINKSYTRSI